MKFRDRVRLLNMEIDGPTIQERLKDFDIWLIPIEELWDIIRILPEFVVDIDEAIKLIFKCRLLQGTEQYGIE